MPVRIVKLIFIFVIVSVLNIAARAQESSFYEQVLGRQECGSVLFRCYQCEVRRIYGTSGRRKRQAFQLPSFAQKG
jgi:hypothetical protein